MELFCFQFLSMEKEYLHLSVGRPGYLLDQTTPVPGCELRFTSHLQKQVQHPFRRTHHICNNHVSIKSYQPISIYIYVLYTNLPNVFCSCNIPNSAKSSVHQDCSLWGQQYPNSTLQGTITYPTLGKGKSSTQK